MSDEPDKPDARERKALGPLACIAIGSAVGIPAFGLIGVYIGCEWLWPGSNLCGLPAYLFAIPLGAPIGACIGGLIFLIRKGR
jgi:hypothetical protein